MHMFATDSQDMSVRLGRCPTSTGPKSQRILLSEGKEQKRSMKTDAQIESSDQRDKKLATFERSAVNRSYGLIGGRTSLSIKRADLSIV